MNPRKKKRRGFSAVAADNAVITRKIDSWPTDVLSYVNARTLDRETLRAARVTFAGKDAAKARTGFAARGLIWPFADFHTGAATDHCLLKPIPARNARFLNPPGKSRIYFAPPHEVGKDWVYIAADIKIPIYVVEGPIKAARLAQEGEAAISGNGCWGLGSAKKGFKNELKLVTWKGRRVVLVPDSDWKDNPDVRKSTIGNADYLRSEGADVRIVLLPLLEGADKIGPDDYLSHRDGGFDRFKALPEIPSTDSEFNAWRVNPQIAALNERHAVVTLSNKVRILVEPENPHDIKALHKFLAQADFNLAHANEFIQVGMKANMEPKMVPLGKYWINSSHRRQYAHVGFYPSGKTPESTYNYWRGFAYEPEPGDWSLFKAHILENIVNGDEGHYSWLINWMAHRVQYRDVRNEVVIVLKSIEEGTGKGKFATTFGALFGRHFITAQKAEDITGNFNARLEYCMLLFADEAFFSGDHRNSEILKSMITGETLRIEPKGVDAFDVPNILGHIMASNNDHVVRAGLNARRFAVFNVNPRHAEDHKYFAAIDEQMADGGYGAMLHDLLAHKVDTWAGRKAPNTIGLAEQKDQTLTTAQRFILDRLVDGRITHWINKEPTNKKGRWYRRDHWFRNSPIVVDREALREAYYLYLQAIKAKPHEYAAHADTIAKTLRQIFGDVPWKRYIDDEEHKKRGDVLPPVGDARLSFEKITKVKRDWKSGLPRKRQQ